MIDITINRLGEFTIDRVQFHNDQCGRMGVRKYTYKVSVTGNDKQLDSQGFLIDNMILRQYFIDTYEQRKEKCRSCEHMACAAIGWIKAFCKENKIKGIKRIYVQISGSDVSFIEAEWKK